MERTTDLRNALLQNHSNHEANEILTYRTSTKDIAFIQDSVKDILRNMPPIATLYCQYTFF